MDNRVYVAPELDKAAFNCPQCGAFANQSTHHVKLEKSEENKGTIRHKGLRVTRCDSCSSCSYWYKRELIYPRTSRAPLPAEDMPEEAKRVFNEARDIVNASPSGAAALLRLAIEIILNELDAEGDTIYNQIGDLVEKGRIDEDIQKAYDTVRVIGNESVHPGTIDLNEDDEAASTLFFLVNEIVHSTITRDKRIEQMWDKVPENKKNGVEQRDN